MRVDRAWKKAGVTIALSAVLSGPVTALADEIAPETLGGTCVTTGAETIGTDRAEYQPEETVLMDGTGYAGECTAVVRVIRPDGSIVVGDGSFTPGSDAVAIPADGTLSYQYQLDGITGTYVVDVLGADDAVLASTTFDDPSVQLFTDSTFLTINNVFRRGDTVYARFDTGLTVGAPQYVKFEVLDPSSASAQTSTCLLASSFASSKPSNSFVIGGAAALSSSSSWTYKMVRYGNDSTCTTPIGGTSTYTTPFYVAKAYAFASQADRDACTAEPCSNVKTTFGVGQTAWVKVLGYKPSVTDITTEWRKPNSVLSPLSGVCRNSSGSDRPDSAASGSFGTGYRPVDVGETSETSPASVAACAAFAGGEQGQWKVKLTGGSNTVELNVFTVDLTVPTVTFVKPPPPLPAVEPGDTGTSVTWKADEAGTYSVRVGGTDCTTGTVVESGSYPTANAEVISPIDVSYLSYGLNTIRVCVSDSASNTGSASTTVVRQVPTALLYTGGQIVMTNSTLPLAARLTSIDSACALGNNKIAFYLDRDPTTGVVGEYELAVSIKTNNSGIASTSVSTSGWLEGVYEVTAVFTGTDYCAESSDLATLTVAQRGDAAMGGGWYTLSGAGRVNFGFTVRKVQGTTDQYRGQIVLINNGKWRLKGTLSSFFKTGTPPRGASEGVGNLYVWSSSLNDWVLAEAGVTFTASFTDDGQGGKKSNDLFGIHINHVLASGEPGLPNSSQTALKGGNITIA
jgi:hypothetical protein